LQKLNLHVFNGGDQAIDLTYTLPTAYPTGTSQVLDCTDAGVMSWAKLGSLGKKDYEIVTQAAYDDLIATETFEQKFYYIEEV